jgi:hypothetical protein
VSFAIRRLIQRLGYGAIRLPSGKEGSFNGCWVEYRTPVAPMSWRYLIVVTLGNAFWEIAQLPLYTIWMAETDAEIVFALVHCTVGDVLIAAGSLGLAVLVMGRNSLRRQFWSVAYITISLGVGYTIFSEWLNVSVRGNWAYAPIMPVLPILGTGLSPLLQWIVGPILGFSFVARTARAARS